MYCRALLCPSQGNATVRGGQGWVILSSEECGISASMVAAVDETGIAHMVNIFQVWAFQLS